MILGSVLIINQGLVTGDVIIKGNVSKVEFALESTSRGESIL